ncbi:MAG: hypothetical protein LBT01_04765 [Spirochaetaceae bacterium]|jgi:hypothetical protein|nr:hypothetical protein [Spirochaetaceae bacterium]
MVKKMFFVLAAMILPMMGILSCGTMKGQQNQKMSIQAAKTGIAFEVVDSKGKHIVSGETPRTITLSTGGFLIPNSYIIKYTKANGETGEQKISWGFNKSALTKDAICILIGIGVVGIIVDSITGAIYTLPEDVLLEDVAYHPDEGTVAIFAFEDVRPEMRQYLVRVN